MGGWVPVSPWKLGAPQTVAIGASSAQSNAFGSETRAVLISATSDCHVVIGTNPTAAITSTLIRSAYPPLVFGCGPGDKIAVIEDSTGGTLYVTELSH